ncbi:hypothetical protein IFU30_10940 [Plantibacter sp. CFBP 8798]|uniref:hypothetical protein n=1 Tax=Plantibacter sp. CFBP 8798 TaxID=2775268 RepID=UPI00177D79E9|nr:hypothetical protein [Plantibacter sp. CFBP 8798]MBD8466783.1 hypothetical protein [Plantibacter sp. CFBP 8798]
MTDATEEAPVLHDYTNDPDGYTRKDIQAVDFMLQSFVAGAFGLEQEDTDASFGITLNVSGLVISGNAIPLGRWTRLTLEKVKPNSEVMAEAFTMITDSMTEAVSKRFKRRTEANLPTPYNKFLHLKDVTIFTPGETLQPDLWRVNVEHVTGWNLGMFSAVPR